MVHLSIQRLAQVEILEPLLLGLELGGLELGVVPVQKLLAYLVEEGADLFFVAEVEAAGQDIVEHGKLVSLPVGAAGRVDGVEGVLLQVHGVQQLALLVDDVVLSEVPSSPMTFII